MASASSSRTLHRFTERLLPLEAGVMLCAARFAVMLLPFGRIGRLLGQLHPPGPATTVDAWTEEQAAAVARGIRRAARWLPFSTNCLTRSLAAWMILRRRRIDSRLHFGVLTLAPADRPIPHAWVDCGPVKVAGYPEALLCTELGFYARVQTAR